MSKIEIVQLLLFCTFSVITVSCVRNENSNVNITNKQLQKYYNYAVNRKIVKSANLFEIDYPEYVNYIPQLSILVKNDKTKLISLAIAYCEAGDKTKVNETLREIVKYQKLDKSIIKNHWPKKCITYVDPKINFEKQANLSNILISQLAQIHNDDQKYRDDSGEQKKLDSINIIRYKTIIDEYILSYHNITNDLYLRIPRPSQIYGHNRYEKSKFIETAILKACAEDLVRWEEMEGIEMQRMFKFPIDTINGRRAFLFKYLTFTKDKKLDYELSFFQINVVTKILDENPNMKITIFCNDRAFQSLIEDLRSYILKQNKVLKSQIFVEDKVVIINQPNAQPLGYFFENL